MKKNALCLLAVMLVLTGCSSENENSTVSANGVVNTVQYSDAQVSSPATAVPEVNSTPVSNYGSIKGTPFVAKNELSSQSSDPTNEDENPVQNSDVQVSSVTAAPEENNTPVSDYGSIKGTPFVAKDELLNQNTLMEEEEKGITDYYDGQLPENVQSNVALLQYDVLEDNTISITWYMGHEATVVIPYEIGGKPVTTIGERAFAKNSELEKVYFPNTITTIKKEAFVGCVKLNNVYIPDSVINLSGYIFSNCTSLSNITLPNGITTIPSRMFGGCIGLNSFTIPSTVKTISTGTFHDTGLIEIVIPDGVEVISGSSFMGCLQLKTITIPSSVTNITSSAFADCSSLEALNVQPGSYAEQWAKEKGYPVKYID